MEKRYIDADKMRQEIRIKKHITAETKANLYSFIEYNEIADVQEVRHGKWIVRHRHEHYPSGKPYDENVCPFCKRADHNGDGCFCGYCGAKMDGKD